MKTTFFVLATIVSVITTYADQPPSGKSRHYVIALAPGLSREKGTEILKASFDLLLNRARPGDNVEFMDGLEITRLASVQVPTGSARERANSSDFAGRFGDLKKFLTESTIGDTHLAGQVRLPQLLDFVAHNRSVEEAVTVVVVGSPLFHTIQINEAAFNMDKGLIPGDGIVTGSDTQSLFGTAEKKGVLRGVSIYWLSTDEHWVVSDMHRAAVQRFWSLFSSEQGAVLYSMTSDISSTFESAEHGDGRPLMIVLPDPNDRGLVMRPPPTFHRESISVPPSPIIHSATESTPRPVEIAPLHKMPEPRVVSAVPELPMLPQRPNMEKEVARPTPVTLDVTVVDSNNHPITNLEKRDFTVLEDGAMQEITSFTRERTPISIGLLIDTSGSIAGKLNRIKAAAASIIQQSQPGDEFFVIEFKLNATIEQDFTSDPTAVKKAISHFSAGGQTALLDAVKLAVEHAHNKGKNKRKAVVLITDGDERDSRCNRGQLLQSLRAANVQLYAIGFPGGLNSTEVTTRRGLVPMKSQENESLARGLLQELTHVSGGRAFYPTQAGELDEIAGAIAQELRTQYQLGYYPSKTVNDGCWRDVRVEILPYMGRDGLTARTRAGYFAQKTP
jgi:Ca-activated chloride channel family protein